MHSFGYQDWGKLSESLAPSLKYQLTVPTMILGTACAAISRMFGMDWMALTAFLVALITELISGIQASKIRGERFKSHKLSRFSFKVFYYLVVMMLPHLFSVSYENRGNLIASAIFQYIQVFLVLQIVMEVLISILENMGTISGKPKTYWIKIIKDKIGGFTR